jgi:hypothetical protein
MEDQETRAALEEHWSGSPADDLETALDKADLIYHDVVVEYPQSVRRTHPGTAQSAGAV